MVTKVNVNMLPVGTSAFNVVQLNSLGKLPILDASNLTNIPSGSLEGFSIVTPVSGEVLHYDGTNFVNAAPGATSGVQPYDADLAAIAALSQSADSFLVSNGTNWVAETGSVARTSIGLGTVDSPQFTGIKIGDVSSSATSGTYVLRNVTTDATETELFLNGSSTRLTLTNDTTWAFEIIVVARRTDADNESARYTFDGTIDRNTNAASISLVSDNVLTITEDTTQWNVTVDADTTNGALRIKATGDTGENVKWVAFVRTVEVTG